MSDVKRYSCWCCHKQTDPVEMVLYSDYAALAARVEELERENRDLVNYAMSLEDQSVEQDAENKRLQKRVRDLQYAIDQWKIEEQEWAAERGRVEAENKRLRELVDAVEALLDVDGPDVYERWAIEERLGKLARDCKKALG